MNKILVLAEKKQYGEVFCSIFGPAGFYRCVFSTGSDIQVGEEDDIIIAYPGDRKRSPKGVIESARKQHPEICVICFSVTQNSEFTKQFHKRDIDTWFTADTTLGEVDKTVKRFLFPKRYSKPRSETAPDPSAVSSK